MGVIGFRRCVELDIEAGFFFSLSVFLKSWRIDELNVYIRVYTCVGIMCVNINMILRRIFIREKRDKIITMFDE